MPPAVFLMHKNCQRWKIICGMCPEGWMKQTWNCNKLTTSIHAKNWIWCPINMVYLFSLLVIPIFFYEFMSDEIYQICFYNWQNLVDSAGDLITISCFLPKNIAAIRAVIKRWGPRISPSYYECGSQLLSEESRRKVELKEIPSCLIPCLLVVFTLQLEILVTTLAM